MNKYKFRKLNARGFAHHLLLPVVAIAAVAVMGAVVELKINHAASLPLADTCAGSTFSTKGNTLTSAATKAGTKSATCIWYVQSIVDAAWQTNPYGYQSVAKAYDKYYAVADGTIAGASSTDNNYNKQTAVRVMAFQATFENLSGGSLSIDGTTGSQTWGALCSLALSYKTNPYAKGSTAYTLLATAQNVASAGESGCSNFKSSSKVKPRSSVVQPGSSGSSSAVTSSGGTTVGGSGSGSGSAANVSCTAQDIQSQSSSNYNAINQGVNAICTYGSKKDTYALVPSQQWEPVAYVASAYNTYEAVKSTANYNSYLAAARTDTNDCTAISAIIYSDSAQYTAIAKVLGTSESAVYNAILSGVNPNIQSLYANQYVVDNSCASQYI